MKYPLATATVALVLFSFADPTASLHAEGPLEPPRTPGPEVGPMPPLDGSDNPQPTMKTLHEIWDKIEDLEGQIQDLRTFLGAPFTLELVPVGNAGNAADQDYGDGAFGAVSYEYKIGKFEVANAQYAQFLNAVAAADPNGLYSTTMGSSARGGITQTGVSPNFTYAVKDLMGDKPVNYVSWFDAVRFCNWLHNGRRPGAQSAGTTEDGAYTLTGPTTIQLPGSDLTHGANGRNAGALFWLPSEDEWYKAAYHQPAALGGDTDDYWLYPTQSNSAPTIATADGTGSINNGTANLANYASGADWNAQNGNVTTVGSGGPGSASFYGAFDMGGNAYEYTELAVGGSSRSLRGGSWGSSTLDLEAAIQNSLNPEAEQPTVGFRVASP